jgi:hypothetical protein
MMAKLAEQLHAPSARRHDTEPFGLDLVQLAAAGGRLLGLFHPLQWTTRERVAVGVADDEALCAPPQQSPPTLGGLDRSSTPKAANLVKLSGNFLLAVVIESLGEAWRSSARAASAGTSISIS